MQTSLEVPLTQDAKGRFVIRGTKLPLELVLNDYLRGYSAERIASQYSDINVRDIYAVLAYYHDNRAELNQYLEEQNRIRDALHDDIEKQSEASFLKLQERLQKQQ
jgi:uncharacterized protein (DUF433 family)